MNETCLSLNKSNAIDKHDIILHITTVNSVSNTKLDTYEDEIVDMIKQVCSKLICILCKRSNLNQSVLKMVATALINTLSLLCNEDSILQNIIDILHMEDSNSSVFLVWSNEEKTPTKIDVHSMISLKIVLAAGICEQNWWHAVNYHSTIMLIISTMSLYCCTKLLHHMLFALQTLRCCLDHTLKQNDVPLDESLQSKIFEVLLGNWENYIPSVMDQNLLLCESFIKCLKQKNSEVNKEKFWHFLTNVSCTLKSKYYMMGVCFLSDFYYDVSKHINAYSLCGKWHN